MSQLQVFTYGKSEVVDSREVARMVEKQHAHLLRDIAGYISIMEKANESKSGLVGTAGKFSLSDFFIPHTYYDSKGEARPCYLLTKKGCDMVANKMTGEKGVLFTAAYVTAFEKMREHIQRKQLPPDKAALTEAKVKNARARAASVWVKLAQANPVPEYQQICAHYASAELTGGEAVLPLPPVREKTYSAAEVGQMLGGVSANMVGRVANQHGLKSPEYGLEVWDKSPHSAKQVPVWRYNEKAVARLRTLIPTQ